MTNTIIRDAILLTGFSVAACTAFINRHVIYEQLGVDISALEKPNANTEKTDNSASKFSFFSKQKTHIVQTEPQTKQQTRPKGSVVSIQKNTRDGQFWTNAKVNSGLIHFLVDTGASSVALTLDDAKKAGFKERDLVYNIPISTAGGRNLAASVSIDTLTVGGISLRDIDALIVPEGLHVSLLGMSYLGQLQKVEASPQTLTLRY